MKVMIIFLLGTFALSTTSSKNFKTVETLDQSELFFDIADEFEDIDVVNTVKIVQDHQGILLYDVKGQKAGNNVSFMIEVEAENAASQVLGACSCNINYRARSWENYRWQCNLWCW